MNSVHWKSFFILENFVIFHFFYDLDFYFYIKTNLNSFSNHLTRQYFLNFINKILKFLDLGI